MDRLTKYLIEKDMKTKKWYESKTIQGQVVALLSLLISWSGFDVAEQEVSQAVLGIFTLVGVGYSIYGRYVTKGEKLTQ